DAEGRCHDQGVLGIEEAPRGGLEVVDVTDVENPVEIGLTSHIGEAHTVNVDPKRPHIAYAVTSDAVSVSADDPDVDGDGDTEEMVRENEDPEDTDRFDLDGFEVIDMSSCMNFPPGTSLDAKRAACSPQVYRYRWPTMEMALGHTLPNAVNGCHELEVYPDDRLTCGAISALLAFDMTNAFDNMGTPTDFTDDKPRGTPLPCKQRPSSTQGPFETGAIVIDCVDGTNDADPGPGGVDPDQDFTVPGWLAQGAPSLEGVRYLGTIHHMGRGAGGSANPAFDSTQDIDVNHETELTGSGQHLIATDERGGGVVPPGASCTPGPDNVRGNGGVHFFRSDALSTTPPVNAEQAQNAYAKTPDGKRAIYRAQIRTKPQGTVCTAHVFQQIPRENRIFMGWYSQGTQVIDFVEEDNGRVRFAYAGHFIPENANTWTSHVFKTEQNPDGTTTYFGATGDFNLGESGRNAIDVWKVTLPPAPLVAGAGGVVGGDGARRCFQKIGGTKGKDSLLGSIAGDRIKGRGGNDRIKGRAGDDCINGGGGRDRLKGSAGNDKVVGGSGRDRVDGGPGADKLRGAGGKDLLKGRAGRDRIRAKGGGKDRVRCGPGRDK
ncbi:MAG: calcium-binding protein, partial [Spirillospora sp.]